MKEKSLCNIYSKLGISIPIPSDHMYIVFRLRGDEGIVGDADTAKHPHVSLNCAKCA